MARPLPAASDAALTGFKAQVPICADESVHTTEDLQHVAERYQVVNIKLDKTGGLTQALRLRAAARRWTPWAPPRPKHRQKR